MELNQEEGLTSSVASVDMGEVDKNTFIFSR
jgi:hypothetical protein